MTEDELDLMLCDGVEDKNSFPDAANLRISADVRALFPHIRIGIVRADVVNGELRDRLGSLRRETAARLRERGLGTDDDPHIAAWQETYREFGTNPRRHRPSAEALCRRVLRGGELPRVNDVVDIYNIASVENRLPCGAYDVHELAPPVRLVLATGGEPFRPIGTEDHEQTRPGEVIYTDRTRVLTRHWNHRDGHATRVRQDTTSVLLLCEATVPAISTQAIDDCVGEMVELLQTFCSGQVLYRGVLTAQFEDDLAGL